MRMGRSFWNNPVNTLRACISHINKNSVNAQRIIIQAVTDPFTPVPKVGVLEPATRRPTGAPSCAPSCSGSPTLRRAGVAGSRCSPRVRPQPIHSQRICVFSYHRLFQIVINISLKEPFMLFIIRLGDYFLHPLTIFPIFKKKYYKSIHE